MMRLFLAAAILCAAASVTRAERESAYEAFKRNDVLRYRSRKIELAPRIPDRGIMSGLVMAYGHVLRPPFEVAGQGAQLIVNGVMLKPSLLDERAARERVFDDKGDAKGSARDWAEQDDRKSRAQRAAIEEGLRSGMFLAVSDGEIRMMKDPTAAVRALMRDQSLGQDRRFEALEKLFHSSVAALDVLENYSESEWATPSPPAE